MDRNKFNILIEELHADLVVFIDDDFVPIQDAGEILSFISSINITDFTLLLERVKVVDPSLVDRLTFFYNEFSQLTLNENEINYIQAGQVLTLLQKKGVTMLENLATELMHAFNKNLADPENELATIIMNYGLIGSTGALSSYKPLLDTLCSCNPKKSVRLFKGLEGNQLSDFHKEASEVLDKTGSKYFLLIVDRVLANKHNGTEIIEGLRMLEGKETFFSILFTSQKSPDEPVSEYMHCLHFQVSKDDANSLDRVAEGLALCAYALFFNKLFELKKTSLKEANRLVIESGRQNMLYLADMAHAEGSTVFETLNTWLELLSKKILFDFMIKSTSHSFDFEFIIGLTSLMNKDFLSGSHDGPISDFKKELEELTHFELFDDCINNFHYPPAPGDIFEIDRKLYILTGQDCDLTVRKNKKEITRKEQLAELIKCNFSPGALPDKQQDKQVDVAKSLSPSIIETTKSLLLNFFEYNGVCGSLEIQYNSKVFYDFGLLDLCCLDKSGRAIFDKKNQVDLKIMKALPSAWTDYYPELSKKIQHKIDTLLFFKEKGISGEMVTGDASLSIMFANPDPDTYFFPVKRICRLKGEFKEHFLKTFWEYKTRKGLNTISLYNKRNISLSYIKFGFLENDLKDSENKTDVWVQLTGNRNFDNEDNKLDLIIDKKDLASRLPAPFKEYFSSITEEELRLTKDKYEDTLTDITIIRQYENKSTGLIIVFPLRNKINNRVFKAKQKLTIYDIFGKPHINQNPMLKNAVLIANGKENPLVKDNAPVPMNLEDYANGCIVAPELGLTVVYNKATGCFEPRNTEITGTMGNNE